MGNSESLQSLKHEPKNKSKLSLGQQSSNSSSGAPKRNPELNPYSSGSLPLPPKSLEQTSSNSITRTPIPTEYKHDSHIIIPSGQHKPMNSVDANKMRFRLFSKKHMQMKKNNSILGKCISHKIAQNLCIFWRSHVDTLCPEKQLELAVLIYCIMLQHCDDDFKATFKHQKVRSTSVKFVEMIRWLIYALNDEQCDLERTLRQLGKLHKANGLKLKYFQMYLSALNDTLREYFAHKYTIQIKSCLDKVFRLCATIMIGKSLPRKELSLSHPTHKQPMMKRGSSQSSSFIGAAGLGDWNDSRTIKQSEIWLKNLDSCFKSPIGKEYFFQYLEQTACYEIVIFLTLYWEFKAAMSETQRFMVLRKIAKTCVDIDDTSPFPINISYDTRQNFIGHMKSLEDVWTVQRKSGLFNGQCSPVSPVQFINVDSPIPQQSTLSEIELACPKLKSIPQQIMISNAVSSTFEVPPIVLDEMMFEMKKLMIQNHWSAFSSEIRLMEDKDSSSNSLDSL